MKTINLLKHGFVRSREDDFSDDGNRFTCYREGEVRVTKLVRGEDVYISGGIDSSLPYEVYSKLPHYQSMDYLNGFDRSKLTDEMLSQFYEDCVAYEKEYIHAFTTLVYPTMEELEAKKTNLLKIRSKELVEVESKINKNIFKLSSYDYKTLYTYYHGLEGEFNETENIDIKRLHKKTQSIEFVKKVDNRPNFYYIECLKMLNKIEA